MTASPTSSTGEKPKRSKGPGFGPRAAPNQALALVLLFLLLAGSGWIRGGGEGSAGRVREDPFWVRVVAHGRDPVLLAFPDAPDLARVFASAGLVPPSARAADRIVPELGQLTTVHPASSAWTLGRMPEGLILALGRRLDLNRASARDLTLLPGLGPSKAGAVVADRQRRGPFKSVDDLARVPGIGPRTVRALRPMVEARPAGIPGNPAVKNGDDGATSMLY